MKDMQLVFDYIESHIQQPISYDILASKVGYSTFYFHRMFTMIFGLTIGEYIKNRRLSMAAPVIKESTFAIKIIARQFQYQTSAGFTKSFRQFHHCTPSEMRTHHLPHNVFEPLHYQDVWDGVLYPVYKELPTFSITVCNEIFENDDAEFRKKVQAFINNKKKDQDFLLLQEQHHPNVFKNATYIAMDTMYTSTTYFSYAIGVEGSLSESSEIIPACGWLVFPCIGPVDCTIWKTWQGVYTYILQQDIWTFAYDFNLEVYYSGAQQRSDYKCELWVPVKRRLDV